MPSGQYLLRPCDQYLPSLWNWVSTTVQLFCLFCSFISFFLNTNRVRHTGWPHKSQCFTMISEPWECSPVLLHSHCFSQQTHLPNVTNVVPVKCFYPHAYFQSLRRIKHTTWEALLWNMSSGHIFFFSLLKQHFYWSSLSPLQVCTNNTPQTHTCTHTHSPHTRTLHTRSHTRTQAHTIFIDITRWGVLSSPHSEMRDQTFPEILVPCDQVGWLGENVPGLAHLVISFVFLRITNSVVVGVEAVLRNVLRGTLRRLGGDLTHNLAK